MPGRQIERVAELGSTNAELLARLSQGPAPVEGAWLMADRQSGGRGRLGRDWSSPPGNLYASTLVVLGAGDPPAHTLAFVAGLAVHDALGRARARVLLKWPNDLLVDGAKLAGILCERSGDSVVVGIGVNVASAPAVAGRETASLAAIDDHAPDVVSLLETLVGRFAHRLARWRAEPLRETFAEWKARAHPLGTRLTVTIDGAAVEGAFDGLEPDGALRLRLASGDWRAIHAGEVGLVAERDA